MNSSNRLSDWVMRGANFVLSGSGPVPMPPEPSTIDARTRHELMRRSSFAEGANAMRDKFVERMTWFAEYAPDKQTADYLWRVIMDVKSFQVTPEDNP